MTLRAKLLCPPPKIVYTPQMRYTAARPTTGTMLTKPTKSTQPNKLIVFIVPTMPSLPAIPTDLACYAYIRKKIQSLNYSFVVGLATLNVQKTLNSFVAN